MVTFYCTMPISAQLCTSADTRADQVYAARKSSRSQHQPEQLAMSPWLYEPRAFMQNMTYKAHSVWNES